MPEEGRPTAPELSPIRRLADAAPVPTAVLGGATLRILHANAAFAAALGLSPDAAAGEDGAAAIPVPEALRSGGTGEILRLGPGLAPRAWALEVTPLRGEDGLAWGRLAQLREMAAPPGALREAEAARAALDALFEQMPLGLALAEAPEGRVTRISAHGRLIGGTIPGPGWLPGGGAGLPAGAGEPPLARAMREGRPVPPETWLRHPAGEAPLAVLCSAAPVRDGAGRVAGGILAWQDITELHRCRVALAAGEARQHALVEAGALAVWSTGPEGALRPSEDWQELTGQTPEEAAGWGWLEAVHPEDREGVREAWAAALALETIYEAEYRLRRPDGGWRWTAARGVPLREPGGRVASWVGVTTDIDSRKRTEQALRVGEARFRTLAEAMPHLVWQTDARGEPEYLNGRMQRHTGLDLATARNGGWLGALHPEDAVPLARAWGAALAAGSDYTVDTRIRGGDGTYRWFQVKAAPVRDAEGGIRHWVGTCTDMEERHRAEAALREALAAQQGLAREADHRIKNSLQLVAALLRLQAGRVEEPAARLALEAATVRVQAVAEAHRALQRSPDLRNIRLADMLRELAAGAAVQHPGADLRTEAPEVLMLDAERAIPLALILSELVAAGLRQPDSQGATGAMRLAAHAEAGMLVVEVAQAGPGPGDAGPEGAAAAGLGETVIRALARQIGASLARTEGSVTLSLKLEPGEAAAAALAGA